MRVENSSHSLFKLDRVLESLGVGVRIRNSTYLPPITIEAERVIDLYGESLSEAREHYKDQISLKSLWLFLNKLKWRYPDDLFEKLRDDDVVEVYSMENTQIFRSFTFFKYCSYTLEDLNYRPWFELYQRDESVLRGALAWLNRVRKDEVPELCQMDLPAHWISEVASPNPFHLQIKYNLLAILKSPEGVTQGYLISNRILSSGRGNQL
jgi:hypothetical protein